MKRTSSFLASAALVVALAAPLAAQQPVAGDETPERAAALLEDGRFQEALTAYEKLIARDGRSWKLLMGLGRALLNLRDLTRAERVFMEAHDQEPDEPDSWLYVGLVMHRRAEEGIARKDVMARATMADAVHYYRQAVERGGDPYAIRYWAAEALSALGRHEEAASELALALKARPGDEDALRFRARELFRARRFEDFLEASRAWEAEGAADLEILCSRLAALARLGRVAEATRLFLSMLAPESYPDTDQPYLVLADVWRDDETRRLQKAALLRALKEQPNAHRTHYYLGFVQLTDGDFAAAAASFRKFLEHDPDNLAAHRHLASALVLGGRQVEAHRVIRRAIELKPDDPATIAVAQRVVQRYVDAREFAKALSLHELLVAAMPDDPDLARGHAALLKELGRLADAEARLVDLCRDALVDGETMARYLNDLALCRKGLGRLEQAEATLRKALESWAWELDARENLGVLLYESGRFSEARKELELVLGRARDADASSPPRYRTLYYLWRLGKAR